MKNAIILIPSYEPDKLLLNTVKELFDVGFPILVVNDGSNKDFDVVFDTIKPYATYLKYDVNKGKGGAMKYGFKYIKDNCPDIKYVITVDGDGQHSTKDIIKVYEELNRTNELVFGVRTFDENTPKQSKFGNDASKFNRAWLTKQYIPDDQCGLRGFPVRYLNELIKIHGNRYEYEMNQITLFQLKQYRIRTVDIETIYLDQNSRTHFSPFLDTCRIHARIASHAYLAWIVNALLIFFIIFVYERFFNLLATTALCYFGAALLYFILTLIVYPSKNLPRRLFVEVTFSLHKMGLAIGLLYIFVYLLHLPHQVFVPLVVLSLTLINIPLARLIYRKNK